MNEQEETRLARQKLAIALIDMLLPLLTDEQRKELDICSECGAMDCPAYAHNDE